MSIKVIAVAAGVYENRAYYPGDVFLVADEFFADATQSRFGWMEKVSEEPTPPFKAPEPVAGVEVEERRKDERDPGEHDQNVAKDKGWTE